jgi:hypothetical protein
MIYKLSSCLPDIITQPSSSSRPPMCSRTRQLRPISSGRPTSAISLPRRRANPSRLAVHRQDLSSDDRCSRRNDSGRECQGLAQRRATGQLTRGRTQDGYESGTDERKAAPAEFRRLKCAAPYCPTTILVPCLPYHEALLHFRREHHRWDDPQGYDVRET